MPTSPSATSVGAGKSSGAAAGKSAPRAGAGTVRQRKVPASTVGSKKSSGGAGGAGMWRFYTEDSPGIKVGPVPVLVMSLLFIASVFMLHIWGKYTRG
ncbi:hypothetical protein HELRODRAFT_184994 [Helobdella robusta]|uniref:Protein transport protein Sec61 subunit beta n=1 Tax=Helobdella robusta TaxID=6412 RepID=T1FM88_HELRO|nr:hypothetical protein HELRODRAFT_184994 [Helobdella robusta]ESO02478.1 hypothetical protein HELRODRAFT_184994 [Helobdella robusta]